MNRKTKQKEAILKALKEADNHPTAQWVYEQVRHSLPHISLGTVYRDLRALRQGGKISELDSGHESHFEWKVRGHYHFHCQGCGAILDLDDPVDRELDKRVSQRHQLDVDHHRLDFYGLCPACMKTARTAKGG